MQNENEERPQDRVWFARAVRRRLADHRMADQLSARGWSCTPPADEIESRIQEARAA